MTNPAEPVLATTSIPILLPKADPVPDAPLVLEPAVTPQHVVVSRNGEVHLRGRRRIDPLFGKVFRDPKNPKRWVAKNRRGLPVGGKTETRAEAVEQLTTYIDNTLLEAVPVSEHIGISTGPVTVVSEQAPQRVRRAGELVAIVGVGLVGLVPLGLLIFGVPLIS